MALRITVEESPASMTVKLEGRVAGPYTAELDRVWELASPTLASRTLTLDLRETTYVDAGGIRALRAIYSQTKATILAGTPWTQYLAEEVSCRTQETIETEALNAD